MSRSLNIVRSVFLVSASLLAPAIAAAVPPKMLTKGFAGKADPAVTTKSTGSKPAASSTTTATAAPTAAPSAATASTATTTHDASVDPFGVRMLRPTARAGRTWFSNWTSARTLAKGSTDPKDPYFQNRGETAFSIAGDGMATASGTVIRQYMWDQSRKQNWHNIELTFYAMRVAESAPTSYAGFITEVRTDDGHVDDPAKQCLGASYSMAMYYDGRAEFKKEASHPLYSTVNNPSAKIWPGGGALPSNQWIGFKATVRDVAGGVELTLYRDLSDGAAGGTWAPVLSYVDKGGWTVGTGAPICGLPPDREMSGAHPIVLIRNDNATMRYKKLSLREVD